MNKGKMTFNCPKPIVSVVTEKGSGSARRTSYDLVRRVWGQLSAIPSHHQQKEPRMVHCTEFGAVQSCDFAPLTFASSGHPAVFWTRPNEDRRSLVQDTPTVVRQTLVDHT